MSRQTASSHLGKRKRLSLPPSPSMQEPLADSDDEEMQDSEEGGGSFDRESVASVTTERSVKASQPKPKKGRRRALKKADLKNLFTEYEEKLDVLNESETVKLIDSLKNINNQYTLRAVDTLAFCDKSRIRLVDKMHISSKYKFLYLISLLLSKNVGGNKNNTAEKRKKDQEMRWYCLGFAAANGHEDARKEMLAKISESLPDTSERKQESKVVDSSESDESSENESKQVPPDGIYVKIKLLIDQDVDLGALKKNQEVYMMSIFYCHELKKLKKIGSEIQNVISELEKRKALSHDNPIFRKLAEKNNSTKNVMIQSVRELIHDLESKGTDQDYEEKIKPLVEYSQSLKYNNVKSSKQTTDYLYFFPELFWLAVEYWQKKIVQLNPKNSSFQFLDKSIREEIKKSTKEKLRLEALGRQRLTRCLTVTEVVDLRSDIFWIAGEYFYNGHLFPKNLFLAKEYFEQSRHIVENHHKESLYLSSMNLYAMGGPANFDKAFRFFNEVVIDSLPEEYHKKYYKILGDLFQMKLFSDEDKMIALDFNRGIFKSKKKRFDQPARHYIAAAEKYSAQAVLSIFSMYKYGSGRVDYNIYKLFKLYKNHEEFKLPHIHEVDSNLKLLNLNTVPLMNYYPAFFLYLFKKVNSKTNTFLQGYDGFLRKVQSLNTGFERKFNRLVKNIEGEMPRIDGRQIEQEEVEIRSAIQVQALKLGDISPTENPQQAIEENQKLKILQEKLDLLCAEPKQEILSVADQLYELLMQNSRYVFFNIPHSQWKFAYFIYAKIILKIKKDSLPMRQAKYFSSDRYLEMKEEDEKLKIEAIQLLTEHYQHPSRKKDARQYMMTILSYEILRRGIEHNRYLLMRDVFLKLYPSDRLDQIIKSKQVKMKHSKVKELTEQDYFINEVKKFEQESNKFFQEAHSDDEDIDQDYERNYQEQSKHVSAEIENRSKLYKTIGLNKALALFDKTEKAPSLSAIDSACGLSLAACAEIDDEDDFEEDGLVTKRPFSQALSQKIFPQTIYDDLAIVNHCAAHNQLGVALKTITTHFVVAQTRGVTFNIQHWGQSKRRKMRSYILDSKEKQRRSDLPAAILDHQRLHNRPVYSFAVYERAGVSLDDLSDIAFERMRIVSLYLNHLYLKMINQSSHSEGGQGAYAKLQALLGEFKSENSPVTPGLSMQYHYSANHGKFHSKILPKIKEAKLYPVIANPYVSTGDVESNHSYRYAYGDKFYAGFKDFRLRPRYNLDGKPLRPYSGYVILTKHPLSDYAIGQHHYVPKLAKQGEMALTARVIYERENTFFTKIEANRLLFVHLAKFPSFHHAQCPKVYPFLYGIEPDQYRQIKTLFATTAPHSEKRRALIHLLALHQSMYHQLFLMEYAYRKTSKLKDNHEVLLFRNSQGHFSLWPTLDVIPKPPGCDATSALKRLSMFRVESSKKQDVMSSEQQKEVSLTQ